MWRIYSSSILLEKLLKCFAGISQRWLVWMTNHSDILLKCQMPIASILKVVHILVHFKRSPTCFPQFSGWFRDCKDALDIEVSKTFRVLSNQLVYRRNNSAMNQKDFFLTKTLDSMLVYFFWDLNFMWQSFKNFTKLSILLGLN